MNATRGKRIRLWSAALLALVLLAGCASAPASSSMQPLSPAASASLAQAPAQQVYCSMANLSSPLHVAIARGIQDYCDRRNIACEVFDSLDDAAAQVIGLEGFASVAQGLVLCQPVDYAPLNELLGRMENTGITVLTFGAQAGAQDAGVLPSDYACGVWYARQAIAAWLEEDFAGTARIALLEEPNTAGSPISFAAGAAVTLAAEAPGAEVVRWTVEGDLPASITALVAEHGRIHIVVAASDELALAALQFWQGPLEEDESDTSVQETDNEPLPAPSGPLPIFGGFGATRQGLQTLRENKAFRATADPRGTEIGTLMMDVLLEMARGITPARQQLEPTLVERSAAAAYL